MSKQISGARLSQGNHVYLYRLLRDAIGCGKQTFMTQVEEALAAGDMAAADLGFETTRELLEELDDCIKLTVFKGGRIYATVIANEQWDAALAKGNEPKQKDAAKKQKSWKKKKGDKAIKAVRPKHVKRPEPEPEPQLESQPEPSAQSEIEVDTQQAAEAAPETAVDAETTQDDETATETVELVNSEIFSAEDEPAEKPVADTADEAEASEPVAAPETPQPKISLTVVYDPEHANAGVTTLESTPVESIEPETAAEATPKASATEPESTPESQRAEKDGPEVVPEPKAKSIAETKPETPVGSEPKSEPTPKPQPQPAPAREPQPKPVHKPSDESKTAPESSAAPVPELPKIPEDYPVDFALEVFCPGPLLHELSTYLPFGADALGIAGEYYWIARERGAIQASRNRATFPLRYTRDGERHEITVRIRRNQNGPGATWAIDKIETPSE